MATERLATITRLEAGTHSPDHTFCVMEAVAYVAGEAWTDHPKCACPVLTAFCITLNDSMPDAERQKLLPFILRLAGSKSTPEVEQRRMFLLVDAAVREFASAALEAYGLPHKAEQLRKLST